MKPDGSLEDSDFPLKLTKTISLTKEEYERADKIVGWVVLLIVAVILIGSVVVGYVASQQP